MPLFLATLLPTSLTEWLRVILVALAVALVSYPLGKCDGRKTEHAAGVARLEKANRDYLAQKARADELAANQRLTDLVAVSQRERDLRDVVATIPDSLPDASRIALGCERLRRANPGSAANLPAACRSPG